jgi:metal-sulfur cluster biosynthetic enzyme
MDESSVRDALQGVMDPEIGASVVDVGLILSVRIEPESLVVHLATTSPACPMGQFLVDSARSALVEAFPDVPSVDVVLVTDSDWSPERMTPELRQRFGWG